MKTTTMVYAGLFCIAMVASYMTWTADPEPLDADGGVVLIDAKPEEIDKVAYKAKDVEASFEQKTDALGQYLWVSTSRTIDKSKMPNPHDPTGGPDEVKPPEAKGAAEVSKMAFKAGKAGAQLLESLAPFRVVRKLDVTDADLADFGLDEPSGTLSVSTKSGATREFEVGATAYGHKNVYLRDSATKEVFVADRSIISPLERADTRLPEKELFGGEVTTITAATISTPSGSLNVVQRNREDASKASWTAPNSDTANATADAWLDKVFRLRSSGYLPAAEKPQAELVFAVKLEFEEEKPVKIEVLRGADETGEEVWFARSEFTRGLVKLSAGVAADAAADVATLFATE